MCDSVSGRALVNKFSDVVMHAGASAFAGALCSRAFHLLNPVHGAVFCAIASVVSHIVDPIFHAIFVGQNISRANDSSLVLGSMLSLVTGTAISALCSTQLGYPITFPMGLTLVTYIVLAALVASVALKVLGACLRSSRTQI